MAFLRRLFRGLAKLCLADPKDCTSQLARFGQFLDNLIRNRKS